MPRYLVHGLGGSASIPRAVNESWNNHHCYYFLYIVSLNRCSEVQWTFRCVACLGLRWRDILRVVSVSEWVNEWAIMWGKGWLIETSRIYKKHTRLLNKFLSRKTFFSKHLKLSNFLSTINFCHLFLSMLSSHAQKYHFISF